MTKCFFALLFFLLQAATALGGEPYYVFYLHGRIVEELGAEAHSDSYGTYRYHDIIQTLRDKRYIVLSEVRGRNTDVELYGKKVAAQIDSLKQKGIAPDHITVIGASKGASIAMAASVYAKDARVKYVLLGNCATPRIGEMAGKILLINELSDAVTSSCNTPAAFPRTVTAYKEVKINTGLEHGFLYRPLPDWLTPGYEWIEE